MATISSLARYLKLDILVASNNFEKVYKVSDLKPDNNTPINIFWHEIYLPSLNDQQSIILDNYVNSNLHTPVLLTSFKGDKSSNILYNLSQILNF